MSAWNAQKTDQAWHLALKIIYNTEVGKTPKSWILFHGDCSPKKNAQGLRSLAEFFEDKDSEWTA